MDSFRLVIRCKLDGINEVSFMLDTCTSKSVTTSNQIATHPLQNGNSMSDHMWRLPTTFDVGGSFSMYGNTLNNDFDFGVINGLEYSSNRLTRVQNVLEFIKDKGILCDLTTLNEDNNGNVIFKQRNNMAITSVSYIEKQVSMEYKITFKEIIMGQKRVYNSSKYETYDFPFIYEPSMKTLGEIITDNNILLYNLYERVVKYLLLNKLFKPRVYLTFRLEYGIIERFIAIFYDGLFKYKSVRDVVIEYLSKFWNDEKKCPSSYNYLKQYKEYVSEIKFYSISSGLDDNDSRKVSLTIDNNLYYINIINDNNNPYYWSFYVYDSKRNPINVLNNNTYINKLYQCNNKTLWFETDNYEVYLYSKYNTSSNDVSKLQEVPDGLKKLYNIQIVVAKKESIYNFLSLHNLATGYDYTPTANESPLIIDYYNKLFANTEERKKFEKYIKSTVVDTFNTSEQADEDWKV